MFYNKPHATAKWGTMAMDWEMGVNLQRLIQTRLQKAQAAIKASGLGAVLAFNFDNIRYITGTHIGEWCRDKMNRYALCPKEGKPFLFDAAIPAKRISCPWMEDRMEPPIAKAAFALKIGEISEPVRVGSDYVLLRLDERRPASQIPFDEAKEAILAQMRVDFINGRRDEQGSPPYATTPR